VAVRWQKRSDGELDLRVDVPANATAEVHVPATAGATVLEGGRPIAEAQGVEPLGRWAYRIGSGRYQFSAVPPQRKPADTRIASAISSTARPSPGRAVCAEAHPVT
jgi:hypothetical protein